MKNSIQIILLFLSVFLGNAQVTNGQYALSISNAEATSNTIDFTLSVTVNSPSPGMRIFGFQAGINFNPAMVNGGTLSAVYVGGRSPELANMSFGTVNATFPGTVRIPISNFSGGATSVDMPAGTTLVLGTYRITNSVNWDNVNANLWLQDVAASGKTRTAVNGYPFGSPLNQYAYSTTTPVSPPGLVLSHSQSSTYSLPLGTLNVNGLNSIENLSIYPNPSNGIYYINTITNLKYDIIDILGKKIKSGELSASNSKIDLTNYVNGVYLLKLNSVENKIKAIKLIKK